MKFTSTKQTLISFTVFLIILFLGSCSATDDTAPPGGPQPDYMSFTLTNSSGATVATTTPLSRGSTYGLVITPTNGTTIPTADYTITYIPADAITINVTNTNSVDFTVNNTAVTAVTVTVTHKTDRSISKSVTLNLAPQDYMRFALTNSSGTRLATATELSSGSTYGLVITPVSGVMTVTADYTITYTPATAITGVATNTNSIDFRVNNNSATSVTITVNHRTDSSVSETITLNLEPQVVTSFQQDIENATTVPNFATARSPLTREVLTPLGASAGATLVKRYVTETGGATTQDGSSWATAWTVASLRNYINAISDASASRVYLVMVAGGTYTPGTIRSDSFSMRNHVAIMGGFDPAGSWGRTGTTIFSGDIGVVGTTTDNSYHVFRHIRGITLGNAHLYGVTITNGNANGTGTQQNGGGMYNFGPSPVLTEVVFSGNNANQGGGMYNDGSSPVLTRVVFSGNTAGSIGGGMYNTFRSYPVLTEVGFSGNTANLGGGMLNDGSSPVLTRVVFSGNTASRGGGMFNQSLSSPVLTGVVFSGNTARAVGSTVGGGGMYNYESSPVIIGAVFRNNSAANGGAMYNNNDRISEGGPLIVNTIFSANTLNGSGSGTNIVMVRDGSFAENIRIAGSVLGMGLAQPTNHIVGIGGSATLNISNHSLANGVVNFGADATLTINGMSFSYPTITSGSAVDLGLFARKHVNGTTTTYYFSETGTGTSWHTGFTSTGAGGLGGTAVDLPTTGTIEDLTATDIAGNARNGRPDAGVYELP